MSRALELRHSAPRYLATRALAGARTALPVSTPLLAMSPLRLTDRPDPEVPASGWARVRVHLSGVCGSDLAMVSGRSSYYFSPLISTPFVPGHEIVGELVTECGEYAAGQRVVVDPVLSCMPRGQAPCTNCAAGQPNRCDRVTVGHLSPGLQIGYCADTGGGWGRTVVAHVSQLHAVPDEVPDERAVLAEPLACAVHTALRAEVEPGASVLVVGAGAVGLFTLLALRAYTEAGPITVVAKHPRQVELARAFGATDVVATDTVLGRIRRASAALRLAPIRGGEYLLGGVDVSIDATGTSAGLDTALRCTRAGGRVVVSGMPGTGTDLSPLWFRELTMVGAYTSGHGDFARALELAARADLDGVLPAVYPLGRWQEALDHAMHAGRLGTVKVAFDPRINHD